MWSGLRPWSLPATAVVAAVALGCGSDEPPARPDIAGTPVEELHGASQKALIYEFRAKVRRRGVEAAREELPNMIEMFEGHEDQPTGDHADTYQQIFEKLQGLQTSLAGSPGREQVLQAAEDLGTLADQLPGKADPNPQVE